MRTRSRVWVRAAVTTTTLIAATGVVGPRSSAHVRVSQVTWTTDVEPILRRRCAGCHVANGFGPMALDTYEDARTWAKAIREEILEQRMPPWPAAGGFTSFGNDRSLSPLEIELVTAWTDGATPLGPPASAAPDADAKPSTHSPDLVLAMAAPHAVTAAVETFELATHENADRWITGWEFRPGNRSLVEEAVLRAGETTLDRWTPPEGRVLYPRGVAQRLPSRSAVALELHYRKSAMPETDRSAVALYFGARPIRELRHRQFPCGTSAIDRDIDVIAVTPRAAAARESVEVVGRGRDGLVAPLAVVPRYQPAYPITYRFRTPVRLARRTAIEVRSTSPGCSTELAFVAAH